MQPAAGVDLDPDHNHAISLPHLFLLPVTPPFSPVPHVSHISDLFDLDEPMFLPPPVSPFSTFFPFPVSQRGLNIFCNNINRANYIGHLTLNNLADQADLILLQEPSWGFIGRNRSDVNPNGSSVMGSTAQQSWHTYHPCLSSLSDPTFRPRVLAYSNRSSGATFSLRSDLVQHGDIMAIEVSRGPSSCLIVNLYNDELNSALLQLYSMPFDRSSPTIITGNFNLHHPTWSPEHCQESPHANILTDWMTANGFVLVNDPGTITFLRGRDTSTIDLTWANFSVVDKGMMTDWAVHNTMDHASDHYPITWNLFTPHDLPGSQSHLPPPQRIYTFSKDKKKEWKEQLSFALSVTGLDQLDPTSDDPPSIPFLQSKISLFHDTLKVCSNRMCATKPPKGSASPWFTSEVRDALREYQQAKARYRHIHLKAHSPRSNPRRRPSTQYQRVARYHVMRRARNRLSRTIAKAKRDWAYEFAAQIEPLNIWKLNNWHKGLRRYTIPPVRNLDGSMAITNEDKAQAFLHSFFPPPPLVNTPPFSTSHSEDCQEFVDVTRSEVESNLKSSNQRSAPGASGISFRALKWAWEVNQDVIFFIVRWSVRLGFHHPDWKTSIMTVLPKPNKPDYASPRAYRPIQLLECLGKLVEKIVARRLMFDCAKFSLLPPEQFGGAMAASCIDAGLSLTHDIESALNRGHTASLLTVDVKGFFDNINHRQLLFTLHSLKFPPPILRWTESFLSDRQLAPRIDQYLGPATPISTGVPQGSPISPILSVIYSSPVLRSLASAPSMTNLLLYPVTVRSYINDFSFLAIGSDTVEMTEALRSSYLDITSGLSSIGMSIDPSKSELIHFSRRHNPEQLLLPLVIDHTLTIHPAKDTLRWLGIFFDSRLSFTKHVDILCNRARSAANGLRVLANSVRGLSQKNLRALHKTCVLPIITWAAVLWFRPDIPRKGLLDKLDRVQNISLRLVCGAFRTTPIGGLQVIAHQPPILQTLTRFSKNAALRLSRLPLNSPVFQRLPCSWRRGERGDAPIPTLHDLPHNGDPRSLRALTALEYLSSLNHPKGERMFQFADHNAPYAPRLLDHPHFKADTDAIPVSDVDSRNSLINDINNRTRLAESLDASGHHLYFCDGSQQGSAAGAGVYFIRSSDRAFKDWELRAPTCPPEASFIHRSAELKASGGRKATSFDAEMLALVMASNHIRTLPAHHVRSEINIFSDSVAALKLIIDPGPHPGQALSLIFISNILATLDSHPGLTITIDWCPGHAGVRGNEDADRIAKSALGSKGVFKHPTIAYQKTRSAKRLTKAWIKTVERQRLRSTGSMAFTPQYHTSSTPTDLFKQTTRELFARMTQTLTGHGYTGEYYRRMKLDASPWCLCSSSLGAPVLHSRRHVLSLCPRHARHRHLLTVALTDPDLDFLELGVLSNLKSLLRFMHVSGAFTKLDRPFHLDLILPPAMRDRMRIPCYEPP